MPFIKVNRLDIADEDNYYINSERVTSLMITSNSAALELADNELVTITRESADYFLAEVDARHAQVTIEDMPTRPLASRLATKLRDEYPEGLTILVLQRDVFPEHTHDELTKAASQLFKEHVIDVDAESGRLQHRTHSRNIAATPSRDPLIAAAVSSSDLPDDKAR